MEHLAQVGLRLALGRAGPQQEGQGVAAAAEPPSRPHRPADPARPAPQKGARRSALSSSDYTDLRAQSPKDRASLVTKDSSPAQTVPMQDASGHSVSRDNQGLWPRQVQLSRGHWRREDAAGAVHSAGWWESVTVTWSPAPAPGHRRAVLLRALAAAADIIAPVLADVAVTSARRLLQRRDHRRLVGSLLRRQPVSAGRELPR
jgi:hypothetical protein